MAGTRTGASASVLEATEQYFAEQDVLKQWLDECTADGGPLASPVQRSFSRAGRLGLRSGI